MPLRLVFQPWLLLLLVERLFAVFQTTGRYIVDKVTCERVQNGTSALAIRISHTDPLEIRTVHGLLLLHPTCKDEVIYVILLDKIKCLGPLTI